MHRHDRTLPANPSLTCLPKSLCSWSYRVEGAAEGSAEVRVNNFSENGGVTLGEYDFDVRKHGMASGRWTLEHEGHPVAEAQKPNLFRNRFELTAADRRWTLDRPSLFSRSFELSSGEQCVADITPVHAFTRRATIARHQDLPTPVLLFAFYLAVLIWRRQASNNAGAT